jgi:hypothetical protein
VKERRKREPPVKSAWTAADQWQRDTARTCAKAIAHWLKHSTHLSRPLSSLTAAELDNMALAAIHTWIVEASRREKTTKDKVERDHLKTLLG